MNYIPLSARVGLHQGRMIFFLNDQPEIPFIYALTDTPGGRWSWEELSAHNIRQFAVQAGFRIFQLDLSFEHIWKEDGSWSLEMARKQIAGVLAQRADAAVMLRLHVRPPGWWMKKHPGENTRYWDTEALPNYPGGFQRILEDDAAAPTRTSLASNLWWKEMGAQVERFCRELAQTPEGNSLMGIQVAGGVYGEWHYWGFNAHEADASDPMRHYFRQWLETKYKSTAALQQAWADATVQFETVTVPNLSERQLPGHDYFRDPARHRKVIDYYEAQHERVADSILYFSKIVKKNWPRPLVTGAFYGYFFSTFGRDAAGGHLAVQKVLRSPDIDFLSGPAAYYPETSDAGDAYRSRSLIDSVMLHKKMWLDEMDQYSCVKRHTDPEHQESLRTSISRVRRNVFHTWAKGQGLWFYDFGVSGMTMPQTMATGLGAGGWWDFPELLGDIRRVTDFCREQKTHSSEADLLVLADTGIYPHVRSTGSEGLAHSLMNWGMTGLLRSGAILDVYHLDDLESLDLSRYKAVMFFNTFKLSAEKRHFITTRVAQDGRHLVWFYAPGYTDGVRNNPDFVEEVTGMKLSVLTPARAPQIQSTQEFGGLSWGAQDQPIKPLFAVTDPEAHALGHYKNSQDIAIARKTFPTHTSWFFGAGAWDSAVVKAIVGHLPVHRYSDSGDVFYAGGGNLILHTKNGGKKSITLRNGKKLELNLRAGASTVVIHTATGEILLPQG